jgi:cytochrome bd-type quinol oxidase subunit 2
LLVAASSDDVSVSDPAVLPARSGGLTIFEGAPAPSTLAYTLAIAIVGLALVIGYSHFVRQRMSVAVTVLDERT